MDYAPAEKINRENQQRKSAKKTIAHHAAAKASVGKQTLARCYFFVYEFLYEA